MSYTIDFEKHKKVKPAENYGTAINVLGAFPVRQLSLNIGSSFQNLKLATCA
jgi:hypothetical protein